MHQTLIIVIGLLVLSVVSGMLGLGVAFAAVPFLGLFLLDLVHQVQPLSLLLNGLTAMFSTIGFSRSGYVDWRRGGLLAALTTVFAPVGGYVAQHSRQIHIWYIYFFAVIYLAYRLFKPAKTALAKPNFRLALGLSIPISILSGFLGVGPGFLLMPTLILVGFEAKHAAGMNALAVTPPSFSALIPHLSTAQFNLHLTVALLVVGAIGSYIGARMTSLYMPSGRIKQLFGVLIVLTTLYKIFTLVR